MTYINFVNTRPLATTLLTALVALALAACSDEGSIVPDDIDSVNAGTIEAKTGLTGVTASDMALLSGYSTSTESITIEEGFLIVEAKSDGGFFAVNLKQDNGNEVLFNETEKYFGSTAIRIRKDDGSGFSGLVPGPAELEIIASTDWEISYTQEDFPTATHQSNFELSGFQDFVIPAVHLSAGTHSMAASNDRESGHFSVSLVARNRTGQKLLVNEVNPQDKAYEFEINDSTKYSNVEGLWMIVISSTGNWSLALD